MLHCECARTTLLGQSRISLPANHCGNNIQVCCVFIFVHQPCIAVPILCLIVLMALQIVLMQNLHDKIWVLMPVYMVDFQST